VAGMISTIAAGALFLCEQLTSRANAQGCDPMPNNTWERSSIGGSTLARPGLGAAS
jgi:hypothetical protein